MATKDEALKMALEALETPSLSRGDPRLKAIQACKEALEQPAQEPVAHFVFSGNVWSQVADEYKHEHFSIPLYTHPAPSWQGLSDDEIDKIWLSLFIDGYKPTHLEYARAIEQAKGEEHLK